MDYSAGSRRLASVLFRMAPLSLIGVLSGTLACAPGEPADPSVVRNDSAGVRLVTSTGPDKDLAWTFDEQSVLRDSAGEPYLFTGIYPSGVVVDRGGRVYVLGAERNILRFDPEGRLERAFGRQGGGPGELQLPRSLGSHGDTLVVHDIVKMALVRWGPDLQPLGDRLLAGALAGTEAIAFRTGGLWVSKESFDDSTTTLSLYADTTGAPLHRVSVARGGKADFGCVRFDGMPKLFSPELAWAASGPRIIVNVGPGYDIWMHEGARPIARVRREVAPRAPTLEDVNLRYPNGGMTVRFASGECKVPSEKVAETLGLADVFPAVHSLVLLSDGTIWAQRTPAQGEVLVFDVFAADGSYAGTVREMPAPVGVMPGGDLLIPRADESSGGSHLVRMKVMR